MFDPFDAGRGGHGLMPRWEHSWPALLAPWQLLQDAWGRERADGPSIELQEEGDDLVLRAELPGIKAENLEVWVNDDALTLRGERTAERRSEEGGYFRTERQYGRFHRTIPWPLPVDAGRASGSYEDGVLEVRAPKRDPQHGAYGRRLDIAAR